MKVRIYYNQDNLVDSILHYDEVRFNLSMYSSNLPYVEYTVDEWMSILQQKNPNGKKRLSKVIDGQVVFETVNEIILTTDAQDTVTPFDGIPDVPADGVTPATITVEVKNPDTNLIDTTANDILYVSTERGKLSTVNVQLVNGVGSFQITCTETVVTTIRVWHPQGKYKPGEIKIQFRP